MSYQSRLKRAMTQRIYVLPSVLVTDELFIFSILGLTDTYQISIEKNGQSSCSCPDCAMNENFCKHLLKLLIFILKIDPIIVESNLFITAPEYFLACQNFMKEKEKKFAIVSKIQKPIDEEDICPICFEDLITTTKEKLIFCHTCGKSLHNDCFTKWQKIKNQCVYCRSDWIG